MVEVSVGVAPPEVAASVAVAAVQQVDHAADVVGVVQLGVDGSAAAFQAVGVGAVVAMRLALVVPATAVLSGVAAVAGPVLVAA